MDTNEIKLLLNNSIEEFKNPSKGITMGVTDLYRAAKLLDSSENIEWCEIRLSGNQRSYYLKRIVDNYHDNFKDMTLNKLKSEFKDYNIDFQMFLESGELECMFNEAAGGANSVQYIDLVYDRLVKMKNGNNGIEYINSIMKHIGLIRSVGITRATSLYSLLDSTDLETTFDLLKSHVDDQLLDLDAQLSEAFMLAFKNARSDDSETLSNALLSGRRLLKRIADDLYPATDQVINGHKLTDSDYINRLAQFMQEKIDSKTQKGEAEAALEIIGKALYAVNQGTNKGVHNSQSRVQTIKTLLLEYIVFSDLLDNYRPINQKKEQVQKLPLIRTADKANLKQLLKVSDDVAKEIIKMRVNKEHLSSKDLLTISGIGKKTVERAEKNFSFD